MTHFQLNLIMHGKIYAFERCWRERRKQKSLTRSIARVRCIYSNISHDLPITYRNWQIKCCSSEIWGSLLLLRRFFLCSFCDLQVTGMLFIVAVFIAQHFSFLLSEMETIKNLVVEIAKILAHAKSTNGIHKFVNFLFVF